MATTHNQLERAAFGVAASIIVITFTAAFLYAWVANSSFLKVALPITALVTGGIVFFAGRSIYKSTDSSHAIDVRNTENAN